MHNFCDTCTTAGKRAQLLGNVHSTTSLKRAHIEYVKRLGGGGETRYTHNYIYLYLRLITNYIYNKCIFIGTVHLSNMLVYYPIFHGISSWLTSITLTQHDDRASRAFLARLGTAPSLWSWRPSTTTSLDGSWVSGRCDRRISKGRRDGSKKGKIKQLV